MILRSAFSKQWVLAEGGGALLRPAAEDSSGGTETRVSTSSRGSPAASPRGSPKLPRSGGGGGKAGDDGGDKKPAEKPETLKDELLSPKGNVNERAKSPSFFSNMINADEYKFGFPRHRVGHWRSFVFGFFRARYFGL